MIKHGGEWRSVDWQTAIEYVVRGVGEIKRDHGGKAIGALVSPHSTVEELFLAQKFIRALGSENVDYRLRHAEFPQPQGVHWLGTSIASLSTLQRALVIGSNLRKEHPLFALRVRAAVRSGAISPFCWPMAVAMSASACTQCPAPVMERAAIGIAQSSSRSWTTETCAPVRTAARTRSANSGWSLRRLEPMTSTRCSVESDAMLVPSQRMPSEGRNSAWRSR